MTRNNFVQHTLYEVIREDIRVVVREAKADRRIELDADAMTKVVEITATQWRSIMAFAVGKKMVSYNFV